MDFRVPIPNSLLLCYSLLIPVWLRPLRFKYRHSCFLFFLIFAWLFYPEDSIARDCKGLVCRCTTVSSLASFSFQYAGFLSKCPASHLYSQIWWRIFAALWLYFFSRRFLLCPFSLHLHCHVPCSANPLVIQTWHPSCLCVGVLYNKVGNNEKQALTCNHYLAYPRGWTMELHSFWCTSFTVWFGFGVGVGFGVFVCFSVLTDLMAQASCCAWDFCLWLLICEFIW